MNLATVSMGQEFRGYKVSSGLGSLASNKLEVFVDFGLQDRRKFARPLAREVSLRIAAGPQSRSGIARGTLELDLASAFKNQGFEQGKWGVNIAAQAYLGVASIKRNPIETTDQNYQTFAVLGSGLGFKLWAKVFELERKKTVSKQKRWRRNKSNGNGKFFGRVSPLNLQFNTNEIAIGKEPNGEIGFVFHL